MSNRSLLSSSSLLYLAVALLYSGHLAKGTSDPVAIVCSPLCEDFADASQRCGVLRDCYRFAETDENKFMACLEPCWELAAPCMSMCANNLDAIWDKCEPECQQSDSYTCLDECFNDTFNEQRQSLTVPNPDIGPFVESTA